MQGGSGGTVDQDDSDGSVIGYLEEVCASVKEPDTEFTCNLCGNEFPACEKSKLGRLRYTTLDKACYNALKSMERILDKKPSLKKAMLSMQQQEPLKFAATVLKLRTPESKRTAFDRSNVLEFFEAFAESHSRVRKKRELLFTRRQYIAWHRANEAMTEAEAVQSWRHDKKHGYTEENDKGELTVAVAMPLEISDSLGWTRTRTATGAKTEPDDGRASALSRNVMGKLEPPCRAGPRQQPSRSTCSPSRSCNIPRSSRRGRTRSRSDARRRKGSEASRDDESPATRRGAKRPPSPNASDSSLEPARPPPPPRKQVVERSRRGQSLESSPACSKHNDQSSGSRLHKPSEDVSDDGTTPKGKVGGSENDDEGVDAGELKPLTVRMPPSRFHTYKKKWLRNFKSRFVSHAEPGKRHVLRKFEYFVTEDAKSQFPDQFKEYEAACSRMRGHVDVLKKLHAKGDGWVQGLQLKGQQEECLAKLADLDKFSADVEEAGATLKAMVADKKQDGKAQAKKKLREQSKVAQAFIQNNTPEPLAYLLADCLELGACDETTEAASFTSAHLIGPKTPNKDTVEAILASLEKNKDQVNKKCANLVAKSKSAVAQTSFELRQSEGVKFNGIELADGADIFLKRPFAVCVKRHSWSWDFVSYPLPLFPVLVVAHSNVLLASVLANNKLRDLGCKSLDGVGAFLAQKGHSPDMLRGVEGSMHFRLVPGREQVLFVPAGHLLFMTCVDATGAEGEKLSTPDDTSKACAIMCPVPPKTWGDDQVDLLDCKHFVAKGLSRHAETSVWKPFKTFLEGFAK